MDVDYKYNNVCEKVLHFARFDLSLHLLNCTLQCGKDFPFCSFEGVQK